MTQTSNPMTIVQPAGDVVERLREPENLVRILIWRDYEDARSEGPFDPLKIEAADTIEALRSRIAELEKVLEPFDRASSALFTRNYNNKDVVVELPVDPSHPNQLRLTAEDFFAVRAARAAYEDTP